MKGRVFELSLADLNGGDETQSYRKIRLVAEDVQGTNVITNFHGMDMTRDKLCSLIRKWQTLIEAFVDVRTTDGYFVRIFAIAFTRRQTNQRAKSTCYAQSGQVHTTYNVHKLAHTHQYPYAIHHILYTIQHIYTIPLLLLYTSITYAHYYIL